jgi:hypothetical protein
MQVFLEKTAKNKIHKGTSLTFFMPLLACGKVRAGAV